MNGAAMRKTLTTITAVSLGAALLSLIPVRAWALELLASFRVQLTLLTLLAGVAALLMRRRLWAVLAAAFAAVQIGILVPIFVPAGAGAGTHEGRQRCTVLTLNLEWTNRDADEVLSVIRSIAPDIVAVEEVNLWWRGRLGTLRDILPYQQFDPYSNRPGVAILSRFPAKGSEWYPLHGRAFASLDFEKDGQPFRFVALHTLPPRSPLLYRARNRQLDEVAEHLGAAAGPTIVAGDFNTTPWSPVMHDFQETTGLVDVRSGRGTFPTWPSWNPLLRVPIDHIFCTPGVGVEEVKRVPVPGSDHIGLVSTLTIG